MASISDFIFGTSDELKQVPSMTPEQEQLLNQFVQMLQGGGQLGEGYEQALSQLKQLMDPSSSASQQLTQPYLQQFQQETVPGLAERFAGMGAQGGALSSSGFGQALGSAGANLQSQLASLKSQISQGAMKDILGQYQSSLGLGLGAKPFGYEQQRGSQGFLSPFLSGAGAGLSKYLLGA